MNAIEKLDKILRRLSSKSRRATTRRTNCHPKVSSSDSDEEDLAEQQMETPKNDRKSGGSRRPHPKPIMPTIQGSGTTAVARQSSEELERARAYNLQQQQHQLQCNEQKPEKDEYPKSAEIPDSQMLGGNNCQTFRSLLSSSRLPGDTRMLVDDSVTQATAVSSAAHDKSCESEDADYVSDYSVYGAQRSVTRKSVYELDMSMDESLPESCGRESGYLSGVDVRYSISAAESPALSPLGVAFFRTQPLFQRTLGTITQQSFDSEELQKKEKTKLEMVAIPQQVGTTRDLKLQDEDAEIPDYASTEKLLRDSIAETKYITTVFELSSGGIVGLIDDVLNEFSLWFHEEIGLLGIACEVHWSVPERHRHLASEKSQGPTALPVEVTLGVPLIWAANSISLPYMYFLRKEALHHSLRQNNRRVLNMKSKTGNYHLPLTMISAVTEENCARDCQLKCFQGVYRRFYTSLLPYQHTEAGVWHRPYWNLRDTSRTNSPKPNPEQFIFGNDPTKLDVGSLVAINVVALKIVL
uniref:Uncharacterized protein n=1 Tax=Setaria digitata TaxID=48799 RepID=A0A915PRN5_9BILA